MKTVKVFSLLILSLLLAGCGEKVESYCINGVAYIAKTGSNSSLTVVVDRDFNPITCNKEH